MHSEDAMELRLTWAEAQELLRPPPSVRPTIVMIEDQEFEEYDVSKSSCSWLYYTSNHLFSGKANLKFNSSTPLPPTHTKKKLLLTVR